MHLDLDALTNTGGRLATVGGASDSVAVAPPAFLEENLTSPVELWEYVPLTPTPDPRLGPFIGAEELHMSHLHCVGEYRWNKTCLFKNLYLHPKANWLYFASCAPGSTDRERNELVERLRQDVLVESNQFLRWEGETRDFWVRASHEEGLWCGASLIDLASLAIASLFRLT